MHMHQVRLRCIAGEAPSDRLRESGWTDSGSADAASDPVTLAAHAGAASSGAAWRQGLEKDCILDARPLDGLKLSAPETATTLTSAVTAISLTLRNWSPGAVVSLIWPEVSVAWHTVWGGMVYM